MEQWIEHAKKFTSPLSSDAPTGEDPRYCDEFSLLKAEIEKKTDVDFERIVSLCEDILSAKAKDLRVASYLVMSLSRLEGFSGLAKGMAILSHLVENFGDALHPNKPKARQSALKWFQQEKVLTFAQGATTSVAHEEAEAALALYDSLFEQLSGLCAEPMSWPELKQWLDKKRKETTPQTVAESPKPQSNHTAAEAEKQARPSPAAPSMPATGSASGIESSSQYAQAVKHLLNYFREQKQYAKMLGTAMSCQWGNLKTPPNEQGKTRLPAPRDASLARIRNALDNEQWEEALIAGLDAFMEPSGQFLLDIPKWMFDSANRLGNTEVADVIKHQVMLLTKRLTKLTQLKFDNDEPFVSSTAAAWLEQMSEEAPSGNTEAGSGGLQTLLKNARDAVQESGIQGAFSLLNQTASQTALDRAYREFCKAQLCVEQERSELALPILLQLEQVADELSLAKVAPEFAMQIWRLLYRLQNERLATITQESSKLETENHIAHLQSLMCTTDVAKAMQWL